jgi:hypothetical protein
MSENTTNGQMNRTTHTQKKKKKKKKRIVDDIYLPVVEAAYGIPLKILVPLT